jgi:hypothetical protein
MHDFFTWLADLDSTQMKLWMLVGYFNLIREPKNRSRPRGDNNNMLYFNTVIQAHDLEEIPLKGRAYTWSNMQEVPLLERLDWVFTSAEWTSEFPNTLSFPLSRLGSDHIPIHIKIGTNVLASNLVRFENQWTEFDGFQDTVQSCWNSATLHLDSAKNINANSGLSDMD